MSLIYDTHEYSNHTVVGNIAVYEYKFFDIKNIYFYDIQVLVSLRGVHTTALATDFLSGECDRYPDTISSDYINVNIDGTVEG